MKIIWATENEPPPRQAYYAADEPYPGLGRKPWWRLVLLLRHRGHLAEPPALRMAKHLAATVDDKGIISDVQRLISSYARHHLVSERTGWTDLARLTARGLVRQLQGSAPGYRAKYRLTAPRTVVAAMAGLPSDLARMLMTSTVSLIGREGKPPTPRPRSRDIEPHRGTGSRRGLSKAEHGQAADVIRRVPGLTDTERARLVPLVIVALRHLPPAEVSEILTGQTRSARDLVGLLVWRLQRAISGQRRSHPRADTEGRRYRAMLEARASRSGPGAVAREAIGTLRAQLARSHEARPALLPRE